MLSLPITLIVLVLAFGALVAAGIPLLLALTAVFATFGLIALPSTLLPVAMEAPAMVLLIGLAVGVDYSMFYLKRERQERAAGRSERAALEAAAATSGRSVLISGLTVMVAMAGMFLTGDPTFSSLAAATILVVAVAVLGSLTVLPALLSRLGDKVDRGRVPFVGRLTPRATVKARFWGAIVDRVLRRPALSAALSATLAAGAGRARAAAAPRGDGARVVPEVPRGDQDLRPDAAGVPRNGASGQRRRQGRERADAGDAGGDHGARAAGARERPRVRTDHGRRQQEGTVANITIPIAGNGTDAASNAAFRMLRETIVPETVGAVPDTDAGVTGQTAAVEGPGRRAEVEPAARRRVRPALRLRADAGRVPLDRRRAQGDRAQPALGRAPPTACSCSSSSTASARACSASAPRTGSRRSCRCSCS